MTRQLEQGRRDADFVIRFLLRNLADSTGQESLKKQVAETMTYVQAQ
jgi:hypothetical protein